MFQTDAAGNLQHANQRWLALLGLRTGSFEGKPLTSFMPLAAGDRHLKQPPAQGFDSESQFLNAAGDAIDVRLSFSTIQGEFGEHAGMVGAMVDIRTRHAVERDAALFGVVLTRSTDAILITEGDPIDPSSGLRILYANPAFCSMTGYSLDEVCGQTTRLLQGPKTDRKELDRLHRALETCQRVRMKTVNYRKDGTEFNVEIDVSPASDTNGAFTHWIAIHRDLTDRQDGEERRLRTLVEGMPQLVWRACDEGDWTWASPQWLRYTGQTQEETHGRGWLDAVHPDDKANTAEAWRGARYNGQLDVEFRVHRASDSTYIWHHTRSAPVRDQGGRIVEWLGTTTDIQALKELQNRQVLILAELQHRTRNLMAVIQSISDRTQRSNLSIEGFAAEFNGRLSALSRVQGLLAGENPETLNLRQLVTTELTAHGAAASHKVRISGPPVALAASAAQVLALALHELATNSVKYGAIGQPSGQLAVTWHVEDGGDRRCVHLEWRESDVIMPGPDVVVRKGYGSELIEQGLPYQLEAKTELTFGPHGVRCLIEVPITGVGAILASEPRPPAIEGRRIMVVEDDYMIASELCSKLKTLGATVHGPAGSVKQALALLEPSTELDAAVLDINLHGELVYPVADALKQRGVPFVFTTGYELWVVPPAYAAVPRCEKPLNIATLRRVLQQWVKV